LKKGTRIQSNEDFYVEELLGKTRANTKMKRD
jgi:hypothetical protein